MTGRQVFSFDQVGYVPGSDNFTIDFGKLGYINPKPPTRYVVEYFIHHVTTMIPYSDANKDPNNMATITYYAVGWYSSTGRSHDYIPRRRLLVPQFYRRQRRSNAEPALELVTVGISKTWITGTNPREDVQFVLLGDGKPATFLDGGNGFVEIPPPCCCYLWASRAHYSETFLPLGGNREVLTIPWKRLRLTGSSFMSRVGMRFKVTNISTETLDIPVIKNGLVEMRKSTGGQGATLCRWK